jgi:hypothetical protein
MRTKVQNFSVKIYVYIVTSVLVNKTVKKKQSIKLY